MSSSFAGTRSPSLPRRVTSSNRQRGLPKKLKSLLQKLDFDTCRCKVSLIVSCAVGSEPGCRERRRTGICGCKPRYLPECLLASATPHGCDLWREGKTCGCRRLYMPRCLVTGCAERRVGRRCECARTTVEPCPHLRAACNEYAGLSREQVDFELRKLVLQLQILKPAAYRNPRRPGCGVVARAGEAAVVLMSRRAGRSGRKLSLWHPDDVRYFDDDEKQKKQQRRQMQALARFAQIIGLTSKAGVA